jgi:orotate phosphoribosyltransferase
VIGVRRHLIEAHVPELRPVLVRAYDLAVFESFERTYRRRDPRRTTTWALDLRKPLCRGEILAPVAAELAAGLERAELDQVAGFGFGAYPLVGAVLAAAPALTGGFVRPAAKGYGFGEGIEGALDPARPVALLDDLLGSGRSALTAAGILAAAGLVVTEVHTVFGLGFRRGTAALGEAGIAHRCLATLTPDPAFQLPRELT